MGICMKSQINIKCLFLDYSKYKPKKRLKRGLSCWYDGTDHDGEALYGFGSQALDNSHDNRYIASCSQYWTLPEQYCAFPECSSHDRQVCDTTTSDTSSIWPCCCWRVHAWSVRFCCRDCGAPWRQGGWGSPCHHPFASTVIIESPTFSPQLNLGFSPCRR